MGQTLRRAGLLLGLGLVAAACGGEEQPSSSASGGTATPAPAPAITFQVTGDPEETRVYKELAESYKADTGRTVTIDEVP